MRRLTRRAVLRLLGATAVVVFAVRGVASWRSDDRKPAGAPVIPLVELDEDRIGPADRLAG